MVIVVAFFFLICICTPFHFRSGAVEQYDLKQRLLQEVDDLEREGQRLNNSKKEKAAAVKIQEAAMRTAARTGANNGEESGIIVLTENNYQSTFC